MEELYIAFEDLFGLGIITWKSCILLFRIFLVQGSEQGRVVYCFLGSFWFRVRV